MLDDIRFRLNDSEHVYFCATEEETRFMLSLIDKYETALKEITRGYGFDGYRINEIVKEDLEEE